MVIMSIENANELVDRTNSIIDAYTRKFIELHGENVGFDEWVMYNQTIQIFVRNNLKLVDKLHQQGFTNFKINMQSGKISK